MTSTTQTKFSFHIISSIPYATVKSPPPHKLYFPYYLLSPTQKTISRIAKPTYPIDNPALKDPDSRILAVITSLRSIFVLAGLACATPHDPRSQSGPHKGLPPTLAPYAG